MRVKVEMNSKGEVKAHRIEIPIQGGGGELGQHAVTGLVSLISGLKEMKTERELEQLLSMVYGWGACCKHCGFLTEKSTDDVMHMAEELAEIERAGRTQQASWGRLRRWKMQRALARRVILYMMITARRYIPQRGSRQAQAFRLAYR